MKTLYGSYPARQPGSSADDRLGHSIANTLGSKPDDFSVRRDRFTAQTVNGARRLTDVIATRPGTEPGSIVIVASRDGSASQGPGGLSGTATLLELGHDLSGETLQRSVVLASVSGTAGTAGLRPARLDAEWSGRRGGGARRPVGRPPHPADRDSVVDDHQARALRAGQHGLAGARQPACGPRRHIRHAGAVRAPRVPVDDHRPGPVRAVRDPRGDPLAVG